MCTATWKIFCVKHNYLTDMYPSISNITAFVLKLGHNPSLMAHSPGHYRVMPSSGKQSVTSYWAVIMSGSQWLVSGLWQTGERMGKRVMLSRGAGRPVEHCLCRGEWRRDIAPSCTFHMGASLLSKLLQTTEVSYRYRLNRLQASNIPSGRKASVWWWLCGYRLPRNDASHYKALWNKDAVNGLMHQLQFYKLLKLVMGW